MPRGTERGATVNGKSGGLVSGLAGHTRSQVCTLSVGWRRRMDLSPTEKHMICARLSEFVFKKNV